VICTSRLAALVIPVAALLVVLGPAEQAASGDAAAQSGDNQPIIAQAVVTFPPPPPISTQAVPSPTPYTPTAVPAPPMWTGHETVVRSVAGSTSADTIKEYGQGQRFSVVFVNPIMYDKLLLTDSQSAIAAPTPNINPPGNGGGDLNPWRRPKIEPLSA